MLDYLKNIFVVLTRNGVRDNIGFQIGRQIFVGNLTAVMGFLCGTTTLFLSGQLLQEQVGYSIYLPELFILPYLFVPLLNAKGLRFYANIVLVVTTSLAIVSLSYFCGRSFGIQMYFLLVGTLPFLLFSREDPKERYWPVFSLILAVLLFLFIEFRFDFVLQANVAETLVMKVIYSFNTVAAFSILFLIVSQFYADVVRVEVLLEKQNLRSDKLLRNILPEVIAEQLKDEHKSIAEEFSDVTVLFADIVDFTQLSSTMTAGQLVDVLNEVFSLFDLITDKHGLEKIKTIGDAYMLAGGLDLSDKKHVENVVKAALEMQNALMDYTENKEMPLGLRIGIHTGPAVAGVIGIKKFSYDIWGNTVNTASRMESHSLPDKIQISEDVYHVIRADFICESRGSISIKGKGKMNTYFLKGPKNMGDLVSGRNFMI